MDVELNLWHHIITYKMRQASRLITSPGLGFDSVFIARTIQDDFCTDGNISRCPIPRELSALFVGQAAEASQLYSMRVTVQY